jgi:hypothetical protein
MSLHDFMENVSDEARAHIQAVLDKIYQATKENNEDQ